MRRFAIGFCVCLLVGGVLNDCFILEALDAGPPDECAKEYHRGNRIDNIHLTHEQSRAHDERCRQKSQKKTPSKQGENASALLAARDKPAAYDARQRAPSPAEEVKESPAEEVKESQRYWFLKRSRDLPFLFYGFWESVEKYAAVAALGRSPASRDVVTVSQPLYDAAQHEQRRGEIAKRLEQLRAKLVSRPQVTRAIEQQMAPLQRERDEIASTLAALQEKMKQASDQLGPFDFGRNVEIYNQRSALVEQRDRILQSLELQDAELAHLREEKSKLLLLEIEIGNAQSELDAPGGPKHSFDYFMVSHRPLLTTVFIGAPLLMMAFAYAGRRTTGRVAVLLALVAAASMAAPLYLYGCIFDREYSSVGMPVVDTPLSAVLLFLTFSVMRLKSFNDGPVGAIRAGFLTACLVLVMRLILQLVAPTPEGLSAQNEALIQAAGLVAFALDAAWIFAWVSATGLFLEWAESLPLRLVGISSITGVSAYMLGAGASGGADGTGPILGMSLMLAFAVVAAESAGPDRYDSVERVKEGVFAEVATRAIQERA